jgi:acyl homoserine lactone synthase
MTSALLTQMFRLRYEVFYRQLAWEVDGTGDLERDEFDDLDPVYVLAVRHRDNTVVGCLRLLPTTGPHMLRHVAAFQPALQGRPSPCSSRVWEISRLAVTPHTATMSTTAINTTAINTTAISTTATNTAAMNTAATNTAVDGFGPIPRALLAAAGTYAHGHEIDTFAVLSGVTVERKANASGIPTTRIGDHPTRIGTMLCTTYCVPAAALAALAGTTTTDATANV